MLRGPEEDLTIPLSLLKSGAGGFLDWIFAYSNELPDEQKLPTQKALKKISDHWFKNIDEYHFPVVTLSDEVKPDALCTIFETLNRTGVKLTAFELLTARFWPSGINLRSLWETATANYPILRKYGVDPYYLLQATSLVSRATPSCKRAEVLDLTAPQIEAWWDRIVEGMQLGLNILCDDCKVVSAKWMPYQTMLVPLSAVLAQIGPAKTPLFGAQRERLKRWFWCAVFMQQYENAPNSQSAKDFSDLIAWLNGGSEPETYHLQVRPKCSARHHASAACSLSGNNVPGSWLSGGNTGLPHTIGNHGKIDRRGGNRRPSHLSGGIPGEEKRCERRQASGLHFEPDIDRPANESAYQRSCPVRLSG